MAQALPHAGVQDVTPQVVADIQARTAEGVKKYGRPLQPHNGRNALQDAYEEALDLCQYLKQALMEREEEAVGGQKRFMLLKVASPVVCYGCRRLVEASELDMAEVVADWREGSVGFFCSAECGNIPREKIMPNPSDTKTEEREHQDGGPAMKLNGYYSQLLRSCADCGQSYDLLWPKGCKGKQPVAAREKKDGR